MHEAIDFDMHARCIEVRTKQPFLIIICSAQRNMKEQPFSKCMLGNRNMLRATGFTCVLGSTKYARCSRFRYAMLGVAKYAQSMHAHLIEVCTVQPFYMHTRCSEVCTEQPFFIYMLGGAKYAQSTRF